MTLSEKLDQLIGKVDTCIMIQQEQGVRIDKLNERLVSVEDGVMETKDLVDAWGAAKTSLRFIKWAAGFAAAIFAVWAALKGAMLK